MSTTIRSGHGGRAPAYQGKLSNWGRNWTPRTKVAIGDVMSQFGAPPYYNRTGGLSPIEAKQRRAVEARLPFVKTQLPTSPSSSPIVGSVPDTELFQQWLSLISNDERAEVRALYAEALARARTLAPVPGSHGEVFESARTIGEELSASLGASDPVTATARMRTPLLQAAALAMLDNRLGTLPAANAGVKVVGELCIAITGLARRTAPLMDTVVSLTPTQLAGLTQVIEKIGPGKRSLTARLLTAFSFGIEAATSPSQVPSASKRLVSYLTTYAAIATS